MGIFSNFEQYINKDRIGGFGGPLEDLTIKVIIIIIIIVKGSAGIQYLPAYKNLFFQI